MDSTPWLHNSLVFLAAAVAAVPLAAGLPWPVAMVAGLALALALAQSSTAIALGTLGKRNLMPTTGAHARRDARKTIADAAAAFCPHEQGAVKIPLPAQ